MKCSNLNIGKIQKRVVYRTYGNGIVVEDCPFSLSYLDMGRGRVREEEKGRGEKKSQEERRAPKQTKRNKNSDHVRQQRKHNGF